MEADREVELRRNFERESGRDLRSINRDMERVLDSDKSMDRMRAASER